MGVNRVAGRARVAAGAYPTGRSGTCTPAGRRQHASAATAGCLRTDPPGDEQADHGSSTIRASRCRPGAETNCCSSPHRALGPVRPARRSRCGADVLCYTSATGWKRDMEVTGPDQGRCCTPPPTGTDTDWTVKAGGRGPFRLRDEPVRRHPAGPVPREPHRSDRLCSTPGQVYALRDRGRV